mmetsp:Transcript_24583/g.49828  ORF Transcript_24583/g.49828 Transcript_24583/m.49828 type:complete len:154 (+) Transcript_24583:130-591(+)
MSTCIYNSSMSSPSRKPGYRHREKPAKSSAPLVGYIVNSNGLRIDITDNMTIGRSSTCSVVVSESCRRVSKVHLQFRSLGNGVFKVVDSSAHHTIVNGVALCESAVEIRVGDKISLGPYPECTFMVGPLKVSGHGRQSKPAIERMAPLPEQIC